MSELIEFYEKKRRKILKNSGKTIYFQYYISYNEGYKDKSFYTLFLFALMPVMIFYDIILVVILWRFCL